MIRPSMKPVIPVLFCLFALCAFAGRAEAFKTFDGLGPFGLNLHFGGTVHQHITSGGLAQFGISEVSFQMIDDGNTGQDDITHYNFKRAPFHHFDDNTIVQSMAYISAQREQAVRSAANAPTDPAAKRNALEAFGELIHTAQDFYSHTNYVEIAILNADRTLFPADIPIVDWNHRPTGLRSGYFWWHGIYYNEALPVISRNFAIGKIKEAGVQGNFISAAALTDRRQSFMDYLHYATDLTIQVMHADLNKDGPNEPEGELEMPATGITLHAYAFDLAVRETQRQWTELEKAIRAVPGRTSAQSAAIIRALKGGVSLEPRLVTILVKDHETAGPISGARITLGEVLAVTNAEGRATMRSLPGRFPLSVSAQDYNPEGPVDFDVPEDGDVPERTISLVPQKSEIGVLVKDALTEQPIMGAEVTFHNEERGVYLTKTTGGDGRALLRPLRGHWSVNTTATFYNRREQTLDVGPSSGSLDISLIPTPILVTVLVLDDARSRPIRSASVTIGDQSGTTVDDGEVSIALTAGSYQVVAGAFGYRAGAVGITVRPGQPGRATIRLTAADAAITVRVVTGQGDARLNVAGASVTVGEFAAVTGADGTARLTVPPGAVSITASRADIGSGQANVEVPPAGGTFTVVLAPSWGEVQVSVIDDQTKWPISDAIVTFAGQEATTNIAGVAAFRSEEEGEFSGAVTHPEHLNGAFLATVRRGETARTTVRLVPARCVTAGDQNSCRSTLGGFCPCQVAGACGMTYCLYQAPDSSTAPGPQPDTTGARTVSVVHACGTTDERTRCGVDARECPCGSYGQCGMPSCVSPPCRTADDRATCNADPEECLCGDYGLCGMPGCRPPDDTNPQADTEPRVPTAINPGRIVIATPADNVTSRAALITVAGTVENRAVTVLSLLVNNSPRDVSVANGRWSTQVSLITGDNTLIAYLGDVSSNLVHVKVSATEPPTINPRTPYDDGAVWRLKAGYPKPDEDLLWFQQNSQNRIEGGNMTYQTSSGIVMRWSYDVPPDQLMVGQTYSLGIRGVSTSHPGPPHEVMSVGIGTDQDVTSLHPEDPGRNRRGTCHVIPPPWRDDYKWPTSDIISFVFHPESGAGKYLIYIVFGREGFPMLMYEYEPYRP